LFYKVLPLQGKQSSGHIFYLYYEYDKFIGIVKYILLFSSF